MTTAEALAESALALEGLDDLADGLVGQRLDVALRSIASTCVTRKLALEIEAAASRIHRPVAAVKGLTYMDHPAVAKPMDIGQGLADTLIESELFDHERGAFTGAEARKKGRFELAAGGTLFLDQIGDINLNTQIKLLRVLQEREFERLGGTETIRANVRLLAATHKDLEKAITDSTFREDLYYRLNVFTIFVPSLRERKADLLLLADHFLEKLSREHHKVIKRISTPAIDMLMSYHWPGNVRELENVLERTVLVCDGL